MGRHPICGKTSRTWGDFDMYIYIGSLPTHGKTSHPCEDIVPLLWMRSHIGWSNLSCRCDPGLLSRVLVMASASPEDEVGSVKSGASITSAALRLGLLSRLHDMRAAEASSPQTRGGTGSGEADSTTAVVAVAIRVLCLFDTLEFPDGALHGKFAGALHGTPNGSNLIPFGTLELPKELPTAPIAEANAS